MSFTSYLIRKFEYTHENIFFRKFSDQLSKIYSERQGEHVLVGNLSCNGHLIDAVFFSRGQISVIDFKDYQGTLSFSENNPWRILNPNGEIVFVAGGAQMRNPFQQVRAYRFSLFQYLNDHEDEILSKNRNDVKWDHTGCIVLFQKPVKFDETSIPGNISRYFHIADKDTIYEILDSRYSGKLELSDNEIYSILKILDVRPENLIEKIDFQAEGNENTNLRDQAGRLTLIKRLIQGSKNDSPFKRILNYYRTIINVERFKEPTASELHSYKVDFNKVDISNFTLDISSTKEFHQIFLKNLDERFPKNLFVGLNISIDGKTYPLLHTVVLATDIKNKDLIVVNLNEFELYSKSLEQLGLTEDIVEELNNSINQCDSLGDKLEALRDHLSISAQLSPSIVVGLSNESLFSSQLLSELKKLNEKDEANLSNGLYKSFLKNEKIPSENTTLNLDTFVQVTSLNEMQRKAILKSFCQPLTVITGPPGTGKSQVVMNLIANGVVNGYSVLFVSKNNKAIDNVKERLNELLEEEYLLRFGSKDEVKTNLKPSISKFISRKNQAHFENQNGVLELIKKDIKDLHKRKEELFSKINRIPEIKDTLPEIKIKHQAEKEKLADWLNNLNPSFKSLFIDGKLKVDIDKNQVAILIQRINGLGKGFLGKLLFQVFYKNGIIVRVEDINNKLCKRIYEFVQDENPWADPSKDLLVSMKENLSFLLKLKEEEASVNGYYNSHLIKVENLHKEVLSLERELEELLKNEAIFKEEIENIDNKLPDMGINALNVTVGQKLHDMNTSEVQHYLDYIPVVDLWKYEEVTDFETSCEEFLKNFNAISVTSLSIKNSFSLSSGLFDLLIIDEASQCDIGSAIPLIFRANKAVIIGDPLQLKHITSVQNYEEKYILEGLNLENFQLSYVEKSLFDYCSALANKSLLESPILEEHYRCHPEIIEFSSLNFYEGKLGQSLKIRTSEKQFEIEPKGIHWIHVDGEIHKEKNINMAEVNSCIDIAVKLTKKYQDITIGIITPFKDQYKAIFEKLPTNIKDRVKVDTVHKYQGDEKDVIIFSTVVSSNGSEGKANFINRNDYLINVAITRARNTLYIVGNHKYCLNLKNGKLRTPLSLLADYVLKLNKVV